jgi:hypothetical protein
MGKTNFAYTPNDIANLAALYCASKGTDARAFEALIAAMTPVMKTLARAYDLEWRDLFYDLHLAAGRPLAHPHIAPLELRNRLRTTCKKNRKREERRAELLAMYWHPTLSAAPSLDEHHDAQELLKKLRPIDRAVLLGRACLGLSFPELAKKLRLCSTEAAVARFRYLRKRLRAQAKS